MTFNLTMAICPMLKEYLRNTLTEDQQIWLSNDLVEHPSRLPEFFFSKQGEIALQELTNSYMKYTNSGVLPKVVKPPELYKKNTSTGVFERIPIRNAKTSC